MSFVEFVGVVIGVAVMIFLVLKHFFSIAQQQQRSPEDYARREQQRQEALARMLKPKGAVQTTAKISPPSPLQTQIKPAESYEVIRIEKKSSGSQVISSLKSPRDLFVIKEILDKPLSMRKQ